MLGSGVHKMNRLRAIEEFFGVRRPGGVAKRGLNAAKGITEGGGR